MIVRLLLAALVAGLSFVAAPTAWACSCVGLDVAESAELHPVVVRATVERAEHDGTNEEIVYTATPTHVWKGSFDSAFQVRTAAHEASCGLPGLRAGDDVLLFAQGSAQSGYSTDICSLSGPASQSSVAQVVGQLGEGNPAELRPDLPEGELPADDREPDYVGTTLAATVLAVLLGIVIWQIFRRRGELHGGR